jgi:hypothetical protein
MFIAALTFSAPKLNNLYNRCSLSQIQKELAKGSVLL